MYYPYLRGRQNELLCIRELLEQDKLGNKITPIIEPVRFNSTLFTTLEKFIENDRDIIIIRNPNVGKFAKELKDMKDSIEKEEDPKKKEKLQKTYESYSAIWKNPHVIKAYLVNRKIVDKVLNGEILADKNVMVNLEKGNYSYYENYNHELKAIITLIPKDEDFKDEVLGDTVVIEDGYNKAARNVDYLHNPDEFFSRNHLVFSKRGYQGFSDYSIVGDEYEESGFAPLAIAIHIVYFGDKNELKVHHFVSDSNENISDPARKFEEAMRKVVEWEKIDQVNKTVGLKKLIEYYSNGKFPGLGVIKKCSIMHHLEMMADFLGDD